MAEKVVIEPMTEGFVLWRCLHNGPLSCTTIDQCSPVDKMPWDRYRKRNIPLLVKITRTYGACAILAREGTRIVGQLRFYPKAICDLRDAGQLCLQQEFPAGPTKNFSDSNFPSLALIEDKTIFIHCMMTGSPLQKENPYQRKGIGTRMVKALIEWAITNNWDRIEVDSFEDIPIIYEITGSAGHTFWEKLGFHLTDRYPHPELQDRSQWREFISTLENQAKSMGIPPERATDRLVMRLNLA